MNLNIFSDFGLSALNVGYHYLGGYFGLSHKDEREPSIFSTFFHHYVTTLVT